MRKKLIWWIIGAAALCGLVWLLFSLYFVDYKYFNRLAFNDAVDQPDRYVRTVIYSCLSYRYTEGMAYPN